MEEEDKHIIKAKIVISLHVLLKRFRESINEGDKNIQNPDISYEKIAAKCSIRKATVTDTFTGTTSPQSANLIAIVEGMGFKLSDFSDIYDSISNNKAKNYKLPRIKEELK